MNYSELEKLAYLNGNIELAKAYALLSDIEDTASVESEIREGMSCIPSEDFLQDIINKCIRYSKSRVTKADIADICTDLEEVQNQINQSMEYAREKFEGALTVLSA